MAITRNSLTMVFYEMHASLYFIDNYLKEGGVEPRFVLKNFSSVYIFITGGIIGLNVPKYRLINNNIYIRCFTAPNALNKYVYIHKYNLVHRVFRQHQYILTWYGPRRHNLAIAGRTTTTTTRSAALRASIVIMGAMEVYRLSSSLVVPNTDASIKGPWALATTI